MPKRDYYEVLGVPKEASASEIKSAYRQAAMKFHPDRNPGDKAAEESFKEAAEAYAVLSDADKRARYDRFGHDAVGGGMPDFDASIFGDFADIFGDLFGMGDIFGSHRRRGPRAGRDLGYELEISLEEAAFGVEKELRTVRAEACPKCDGSGAKSPSDLVTCPACRGTGQQTLRQGFLTIARSCSTCGGSGRSISKPCDECSGAGRVRRERAIRASIPAGVDDGNRLRLRGEGEPGEPGGRPGDLYVIIHVREHPIFKRAGRDLYCEFPISFSQAALGAEIEVPVLGGGSAKVSIPAGTQFGAEFRLRGRGVKEGRSTGDQIVRAVVRTPVKLSKEGRKALRSLAESGDEAFTEEDRTIFDKVKDLFS